MVKSVEFGQRKTSDKKIKESSRIKAYGGDHFSIFKLLLTLILYFFSLLSCDKADHLLGQTQGETTTFPQRRMEK